MFYLSVRLLFIVLAYNQAKNKSSIYIKMIALLFSEFNDVFFVQKYHYYKSSYTFDVEN